MKGKEPMAGWRADWDGFNGQPRMTDDTETCDRCEHLLTERAQAASLVVGVTT